MTINRIVLGWALVVTSILLMGFTLPGSPFMPGDVISAAEMNAKFAALESAMTAQEAASMDHADAITALEGRPGMLRAHVVVHYDTDDREYQIRSHWNSKTTEPPTVTWSDDVATVSWEGQSLRTSENLILVQQFGTPARPDLGLPHVTAMVDWRVIPVGSLDTLGVRIQFRTEDNTPIKAGFCMMVFND